MRIGLYSGTFDPMHEGHVLFAQLSAEQFGLEEVLILPEQSPRYKPGASNINHRIIMAERALESAEAKMRVLALQDQPSHTIKGVIAAVYEKYPEDEYYLLMGADVYRSLPNWGSRDDEDGTVADIAGGVGFIVGISSMKELPELKDISEKHELNTRFIEVPVNTLSSRKIREDVASGESPRGLNDRVAEYVSDNGLYL